MKDAQDEVQVLDEDVYVQTARAAELINSIETYKIYSSYYIHNTFCMNVAFVWMR